MAQILIRNLDDDTVAKLKQRAERNGRSLEAEVRLLLTSAVQFDTSVLREVRAKFDGRKFNDTTDLIREDRDR